jgi:hypothetical protein
LVIQANINLLLFVINLGYIAPDAIPATIPHDIENAANFKIIQAV